MRAAPKEIDDDHARAIRKLLKIPRRAGMALKLTRSAEREFGSTEAKRLLS